MIADRIRATTRCGFAVIVSLALACVLVGCGDAHDEHEGHDHGAVEKKPDPDPHAGHDHSAHEGEKSHEEDQPGKTDHAGEDKVTLTAEQKRQIGLKLKTAGGAKIHFSASFPGETVLNADRVAHVVPRAPGVVRKVRKTLGDKVKTGEVLALVDSPELGAAKLEYFSKISEVNCCQIELPRARAIFKNTAKLLALLKKSPSVDEIARSKIGEMGEYRGKLVSAYAEFAVTRKTYEREKALREKGVSSEGDFLAAAGAFKKARAEYMAMRDSVAYEVKVNLFESARSRQLAELEAVAAEQTLYIKGLSTADVKALKDLIPKLAEPGKKCKCDDPNCKDEQGPVLAMPKIAKNGKLAWYPLRAPFDGTIVEKHITLGERVGDDSEVFTIADLRRVWVSFNVFQKDLPYVKTGQKARVSAGRDLASVRGTIVYVAPIIGKESRTVQARIVLDNTDGRWRPGLFVNVHVTMGDHQASVAVPKTAVQTLGEARVVFVEEGGGFVPHPVKLGRSDASQVEIISGLKPGQRYVVSGAFELKAKIITSSLDAHAGHGH
jgi:membrane fusion protein, heavy metal efflux system